MSYTLAPQGRYKAANRELAVINPRSSIYELRTGNSYPWLGASATGMGVRSTPDKLAMRFGVQSKQPYGPLAGYVLYKDPMQKNKIVIDRVFRSPKDSELIYRYITGKLVNEGTTVYDTKLKADKALKKKHADNIAKRERRKAKKKANKKANKKSEFGKKVLTEFGKKVLLAEFGKKVLTEFGKKKMLAEFGKKMLTEFGKKQSSFGKKRVEFGKKMLTSFGKKQMVEFGKKRVAEFGKKMLAEFGKKKSASKMDDYYMLYDMQGYRDRVNYHNFINNYTIPIIGSKFGSGKMINPANGANYSLFQYATNSATPTPKRMNNTSGVASYSYPMASQMSNFHSYNSSNNTTGMGF
jgi:hypothetical protein